MADEASISLGLSFLKGLVKAQKTFAGTFDITGSRFTHQVQTIGTSEEALVMGDLASAGWCFVFNHDDENFVEIRAGSGAADLVKVPPESPGLFYLASATPYAIADTANCELEYLILEA
jgi:hypothetical protein